MGVQADALRALDDTPRTAAQVRDKIGMWASDSVRHALNHAYLAGRIERETRPFTSAPNGQIHLYRRPA